MAPSVKCIVMCFILSVSTSVFGQDSLPSSGGSSIPGASVVTGILATSADGVSRYLAPDGPIQPALTAIGALPIRAVELANSGITGISSGMDSMANSIARAGGNEQIAMPGLAALQSVMPSPVGQLGNMASSMIQTKNRLIMGQANAGIDAGNRLRTSMEQGLHGANNGDGLVAAESGHHEMNVMMSAPAQMMGDMSKQVEQGTASQLSRQLQNGMQQNMQMASGMMGQMHGNMGGMAKEAENMMGQMQNGLAKTIGQVQSAAEQRVKSLHKSASGLLDNLGSMMQAGHGGQGGQGGQGGRY